MKNKHGGRLLFAEQDRYGPIEVIELQQKMRSLHFGNRTQQATMFLHDRNLLVHKYTQAMLLPLAWRQPARVLILGLGGGSLAKFLLHHFPQLHIDAVELRPLVADIARHFFGLPKDDPRLHLHFGAAEDFLTAAEHSKHYDLILIDLFLTTGDDDVSVGIEAQIQLLQRLLNDGGNVSINVIGNDYKLYPGLQELRKQFAQHLYMIEVEQSNRILLACDQAPPPADTIDFTTQERRLRLSMRSYFDRMLAL